MAPDLERCRNPATASRERLPVTLQEIQLDMLLLELDITVDYKQSQHPSYLICNGIFE